MRSRVCACVCVSQRTQMWRAWAASASSSASSSPCWVCFCWRWSDSCCTDTGARAAANASTDTLPVWMNNVKRWSGERVDGTLWTLDLSSRFSSAADDDDDEEDRTASGVTDITSLRCECLSQPPLLLYCSTAAAFIRSTSAVFICFILLFIYCTDCLTSCHLSRFKWEIWRAHGIRIKVLLSILSSVICTPLLKHLHSRAVIDSFKDVTNYFTAIVQCRSAETNHLV